MTMRGKYDYLNIGDWNAICALCGRKGKASDMVKLPKGIPQGGNAYVHNECWIARNPQDFVRGVKEKMTPPWVQPPPADTFVEFCTTVSGIADYAIADCALADKSIIPGE